MFSKEVSLFLLSIMLWKCSINCLINLFFPNLSKINLIIWLCLPPSFYPLLCFILVKDVSILSLSLHISVSWNSHPLNLLFLIFINDEFILFLTMAVIYFTLLKLKKNLEVCLKENSCYVINQEISKYSIAKHSWDSGQLYFLKY